MKLLASQSLARPHLSLQPHPPPPCMFVARSEDCRLMADSGRRKTPGSALPAGVAGAPSELQPLLVLTANAVFMRTEATSADQEIRPCDIALRKANRDAINGLKTSKGRLYPRSACRLEDHRIFNSSSAAYHYWAAAGRRTLSIVSWYASSFRLVVGWKALKITCICFFLIMTFNNVILCCISLRYGATKLNDQHPPAKYDQRG